MNKFIILFLLLTDITLAQNYNVTGEVKDSESGLPLGFASISIFGNTNGTTTNYDGQFLLKLNEGTYKLCIFRSNISYNSFKKISVTASIGVIL